MTYLILHWTLSFLLFRFVLRALFKPISDYILKPFLVSYHNWICVPMCGLSHHLCVLCTHTCSPCLRFIEIAENIPQGEVCDSHLAKSISNTKERKNKLLKKFSLLAWAKLGEKGFLNLFERRANNEHNKS